MRVSSKHTTVREIIGKHRVFLVDNYGVLTQGRSAIPGVARTFEEIRSQGKRTILVSNTGNSSVNKLQQQLNAQGIPIDREDIVTSGRVLIPYFAQNGLTGSRVLCVGNQNSADYVVQAGGQVLSEEGVFARTAEVDVVVVGMLPVAPGGNKHFGPIDLELVNTAINVLKMRKSVPGIILNPDVLVPYDDVSVVLGTGAIGRLIEECSGRVLARLGKPFKPIYDMALSLCPSVPKEEIVMVGDSLEYDVAGAKNVGIRSLLVMSGNTRTEDEVAESGIYPDYIAPSFALE